MLNNAKYVVGAQNDEANMITVHVLHVHINMFFGTDAVFNFFFRFLKLRVKFERENFYFRLSFK